PKDNIFERRRRRYPGKPAPVAHRQLLQRRGVFVERPSVLFASLIVELQPDLRAVLGIDQLQFAAPGRGAVFLGIDLNEQQLVSKVGEILQRLQTVPIVQKVGKDDDQ